MKPIEKNEVELVLKTLVNTPLYIHLETTNGAYATHKNERPFSAGAFIRNAVISFEHAKMTGEGPYRVGLKMEHGWVYGEGLTDWEIDQYGRLLLAGHDHEGKLAIALQLSKQPF
ncbi:MAG: YojF family protein [Bacillaceae bacterium]